MYVGNTAGLAHWGDADLEERALSMAIEEAWEEDVSERKVRPWAANGRGCRVGEVRFSFRFRLAFTWTFSPLFFAKDGQNIKGRRKLT